MKKGNLDMPIDSELIHRRIDIIERNLNFLELYKNTKNEEFLESYRDIQACKFSLFEVIESSIDIASHIIAKENLERAEYYSDMFKILGKNDVINKELSENLSNMAKFRNFLIHKYPDVDNTLILAFIKTELINIKSYIGDILKLM